MKFCLGEGGSFSGSQLEVQKGWKAFAGGSHWRCAEGKDVHPFPEGKELAEAAAEALEGTEILQEEISSRGHRGCLSTGWESLQSSPSPA